MLLPKRVLIITGPTGVGKTDLVLKLAAQFPAEIINADMGQMYTPLKIGTAKPDWQNDPIMQHGFDILSEPKDFSCMQFRNFVSNLVPKIWERGKTPIIVGGSTMYIKSLFYGPANNYNLQQERPKEQDLKPADDLWEKLNLIDPARAQMLHVNDAYRIQRALDIWQTTGNLPSSCTPNYDPIFKNMSLFIINSSKDVLYARTDARVHQMMQMGWVQEVAGLNKEWQAFLRQKKIIGYELILDFLEQKSLNLGANNLDANNNSKLVLEIQKRVRNYAKRQQTFWRRLQKDLLAKADMQTSVFELDLSLQNVDFYLDQIWKKIRIK